MADAFDPIAEARRQWEAHGWSEAAPAMAAVTSVMRAQQLFLARVDAALAPFGLTFARFELLRLLAFTRHGELPLGKVGERLQVHATSVTSAVNRLEGQGFVRRTPHPTDGRTTLATITDAGRVVVEDATRVLNDDVFADIGLGEREAAQLFRLLEKVRRSAGD
jgi:DNA-binding MarR family transcriptional regulator